MGLARAAVSDEVFDRAQVCAVYQPIVDLSVGDVVGVEALARWPELSITPDVAFEYARHEHRVAELDSLCQRAAIEGLRGSGLPPGFTVFFNVEPGQSVQSPDGAVEWPEAGGRDHRTGVID